MKTNSKVSKRIISLLLTLLMVLSMVPVSVFSVFAVTDVTAIIDTGVSVTLKDTDGDDNYEINNADELYAFAALVNSDHPLINAELTADIVVNEDVMTAETENARVWTPIGSGEYGYKGYFNGNNKTISGLYFNDSSTDNVGLFSCILENGVINVGVENSYFCGGSFVGGIAGKVGGASDLEGTTGTIENCYNIGTVSNTLNCVGGIAGCIDETGTVESCYNAGNVSGKNFVGGVAGLNSNVLTNCYNTGTVNGRSYVGGVVGRSFTEVTNCYCLDTACTKTGYAVAKTAEQFASGEVAYLLGDNFGQTIGEQAYPVIGGAKVYLSAVCPVYSNTDADVDHIPEDVAYKAPTCAEAGNEAGTKCSVCGEILSGVTEISATGEHIYEDGFCTVCGIEDPDTNKSDTDNPDDGTDSDPVLNGWVTENGNWYYYENGVMATDKWISDENNNWYYVGSDGTMVTEQWIEKDGDWYYLGADGKIDITQTHSHSFDNDCDTTCNVCTYTRSVTHSYTYGFCTVCDAFEPAILTTDKHDVTGDGVFDAVYEIANAGQLYWFADKVNNDNENFGSANAILTDNIVVNEGVMAEDSTDARVWTPIGNRDNWYSGSFDGNGYFVSGLYFNDSSAEYVGLFGFIGTGNEVKNIGVIKSYFNALDTVGGVAGYVFVDATVENCYSTSTVCGSSQVGGVIGYADQHAAIVNCYNIGTVSGGYSVGGVFGRNDGTVDTCYNTGGVTGDTTVGGVVGANIGTLKNCYNTGDITGRAVVGGVSGDNAGTIANCYSAGTVSGEMFVGGVLGNNSGEITNCYYLDTTYAGGIGDGDSVDASDVAGSAEAVTEEVFESGEIAYKLQGEQTEAVWGQTIGTDSYPVLGGDKVYMKTDADGNVVYYNEVVEEKTDKLMGYSISLGDKIAVNYYMSLTEETLNDENAKMVFTVPDTGSYYTVEIPVTEAAISGNYYVFTCEVAAKEMTSVIKAKLVTTDSELALEDYSVQKYAEYLLANPDTYAKEQALVKAMLNYGASAQIYFNYNTSDLANDTEYMTEEEKAVALYGFAGAPYTLEGEEAVVTYYGTALSLETELAFKHYFIVDESVDAESLEITCDYPVTLKKNGSFYELTISDIPAHKIGENSLEVTLGGITLDYTIYSYGALAQSAGKTELWTVVSALAHYANAASTYAYK